MTRSHDSGASIRRGRLGRASRKWRSRLALSLLKRFGVDRIGGNRPNSHALTMNGISQT